MRYLMWLLVGLTCVMLAGCPAKDNAAGNGDQNTQNTDNGGGEDWGGE